MTIAERILETLQDLPPQQQAEVLDFAAFLRDRLPHGSEGEGAALSPLPVLAGRVPQGWKDAIYEPRLLVCGGSTPEILKTGAPSHPTAS